MAVTTEVKPPIAQEAVKYVDLELVLFKRYHRGGSLYESDTAYRFTEDQARMLLEEVEESTGRPVWRRYKAKPVAQQPNSGVKNVVDATKNTVAAQSDPNVLPTGRRIDVGDDSEIADILAGEGQAGGDQVVTV